MTPGKRRNPRINRQRRRRRPAPQTRRRRHPGTEPSGRRNRRPEGRALECDEKHVSDGAQRAQLWVVGAAVALLAVGCLLILRPFISAALWAAILCFSTWPLFLRLEQVLGGRRGL